MITPAVTTLFHSLEQGGVALTSTRRLARQVEQRYAEWKTAGGATAWPTPRIRVLDDWLLESWQGGAALVPGAPGLLSEDQELLLWEGAIRRRAAADGNQYLLQLTGTARAACRTWRRIHDWEVDWERLRGWRGADIEAFAGWAGDVRAQLSDRGWLTRAELPARLLSRPEPFPVPGSAWWLGFDPLPPVYERLAARLKDGGCALKWFDGAGIAQPGLSVAECADVEDQWSRIARWARSQVEADPSAALGVVCLDLHTHRDQIEDILEDVLHPELAFRPDASRAFHLSLGRSLSEYPIVGAALDLLRWTGRRVPFDVVSRTLRSPYTGAANLELEARADFEIRLRELQQESFALGYLAALASRRSGLESLGTALGKAAELRMPRHSDPAGWASLFSDWLGVFGWPGERTLNSHEFQTVKAWRDQLARFAGLAAVQSRWTLADAVKKLASMASGRILQFHDDQAPIQVMGVAEAPGLWFDKLWLADMGDAAWPPPARPDPFLPVSVQKEHGMPEASPQGVLEHTRSRTANLLSSAGQIHVSFVSRDEEAPVALSPLFDSQAPLMSQGAGGYGGRTEQLAARGAALETVADHGAPPVEGDHLHGGVSLVADQARCPFRALAHHRLRARDLPEVAPGLSARERGILVHEAAKQLWDRLGDSGRLAAADGEARRSLAQEAAAVALRKRFADSEFQSRLLDIERERLSDLLQEWLGLEARRGPFRVAGTEVRTDVQLGGVEFSIRADRVDELEDGRRAVIDYKTGDLPRTGEWADPRMEEPQLPMYALGLAGEVGALVLAGIRRGRCELRGVGERVDGIPSLKPLSELGLGDMDRIMTWWRSALSGLVAEYRRGVARVEPKHRRVCQTCDAMPLCRIFERSGGVE